MPKTLLFSLLAAVLLFSGCVGKLQTEKMTLQTKTEKIPLTVEVADSEEERTQGLMNREKLAEGTGMWFSFEDEAPRNFWMKNTLIPLDILFFNAKKEIISIVQNMEPCKASQCPSYASDYPAMYALELPAGFVNSHSIQVGDKIVEN